MSICTFLLFIDDHSRHVWLYLMKDKSKARTLISNFLVYIFNQYDRSIKTIQMDNG